ncbi:sugar phosphate nucleotidyltransferase [Alteribacillus sp. HJP-4]|uniref:sugar phosphate nucleotidyltransferase n=1 Tax=Alteribacillus sp. HJP-4 TaxID=2775394 RepID=UPI0035CD04D6
MKGLILAAGRGTRLRPLSYTKPKPLLPVMNQPVISYSIEKLRSLGIYDIGIVIHPDQQEVFQEYLVDLKSEDIQLSYIYQTNPKGIAHAVGQAEEFIGTDDFLLLLGDNLIGDQLHSFKKAFESEEIHGTVMVTKVKEPSDYGIAEIKHQKIVGLEEKPAHPKSNMAVIGAYLFDFNIFCAIKAIKPSARGEYEITDAIQWMIDNGFSINYLEAKEPTFDVGTMERWLEANQWLLQNKYVSESSSPLSFPRTVIIPPVIIGESCKIKDAVIGPYVSIDSDVVLKKMQHSKQYCLKKFTNKEYTLYDCRQCVWRKIKADRQGFERKHTTRCIWR